MTGTMTESGERAALRTTTSRARRAARRAAERQQDLDDATGVGPASIYGELTIDEVNETGSFIVTYGQWYC